MAATTFKASLFASFTNDSLQGTNYTQDLKDRGLRTPNRIKETYDINPAVGGPLMRDRLWFYASGRWVKNANYVGGMFYNRNALNAAAWTYDPDSDSARVRRCLTTEPQRSTHLAGDAEEQDQRLL